MKLTKSDNSIFPLDSDFLIKRLHDWEIDLNYVSIRELNRLVDELSDHFDAEFLRFEFGVPGLNPNKIGPEEEIKILKNNPRIPSTYPPFDGVPRLKEAASNFIKNFLDIDVPPRACVPTVGAMHSGFICQAISGRRVPGSDTILYLDPGFPVNKLQTKFLNLKEMSIDLFDYRGASLLNKIEKIFSTGEIGGLLWSSPNNPAWVCLKEAELEGIGRLLTKYDVIGMEDSAYFGMDYRQDYSRPGEAPFIPTIARYTDNYFLTISSSKIFSYAGQRIAITIISPSLLEKRYKNLRNFFDTERIGHAFVHGGIYPTTAGVPQSPQYGLAALFESASNGDYNFLDEVKVYSIMAKKIKIIFDRCGFELVYDLDMEEPIGDGFYFTIYRPGMSGEDLLFQMLRYGMAGIPLSTTGSTKEGVRICVSMIRESQLSELEKRLGLLDSCIKSL